MSTPAALRVLVLPSWCPDARVPHRGLFFVQQAAALARLRPEWTVGLVHSDLLTSRFSYHWKDFWQFCTALCTKQRFAASRTGDGLYVYQVWKPWQRYLPPAPAEDTMAQALTQQARVALRAFTAEHGTPHLIHAHVSTPGGTAAARLGTEFGIPAVLTEHMGPFPWPEYLDTAGQPIAIVHEAFAGARGHAAVSASLARTVRGFGLSDHIRVIPNLVDENHFIPASIPPMPQDSSSFSLLTVGGPDEEKGTDSLLYALAELEQGVTLTLVGNGPKRPLYEQLAARLGLVDRVHWLGAVPPERMAALYQTCDAFVLPSRSETFGVSCVEALMCGKPVIATACGGPEDIVHAGNGLLVPVDDAHALAEAIQRVRADRSGYPPQAVRADAVARFGAGAVVDALEVFYRDMLTPSS